MSKSSNDNDKEARRLKAEHGRRLLVVVLAMLSAFGLSAWLTAKGMFDKAVEAAAATTEGMVTAAMSATVAATLLGTATMALFGLAMIAAKREHWRVAVLAGALLPFMIGISTNFAIMGNAGPPSVVYDMRDRAADYAAYYEAASMDVAGAKSAMVALAPTQETVCTLAEGEGARGVLTQSAGQGEVYAAYFSAWSNIGKITETLAETVLRSAERNEEAAAILAALKAIPNDTSLSVFERQAAFRLKAGELRALIEEAGAEKVSRRLTAQLEILKSSVAALGVRKGAYGKRQSEAIASLTRSLEVVAQTVGELVESGPVATPEPPGELRDMGAAVAAYWKRNTPQILLALMIDLMALWFAAMLMVSRGIVDGRSGDGPPKPPTGGVAVGSKRQFIIQTGKGHA